MNEMKTIIIINVIFEWPFVEKKIIINVIFSKKEKIIIYVTSVCVSHIRIPICFYMHVVLSLILQNRINTHKNNQRFVVFGFENNFANGPQKLIHLGLSFFFKTLFFFET